MQTCRLGQTDLIVSRLGLGTVKFGRTQGVKYPHPFVLPTDAEIVCLLETARSLGINLLDTAPAYGESEARIGKLLENSKDWIICSKVGEQFSQGQSYFDFTPQAICSSIEASLKRLRRDYLDIVLVHSNGCDLQLIQEEQVFSTLQQLKQAGKILSFGMSSKTVAGGMLTIDQADLAMVTYHPDSPADQAVIDHAHKQNKGIFIKKGFASGHLNPNVKDPITAAMQFIFQEPGVTSLIVGTLNPEHLRQNAACLERVLTNLNNERKPC